MKQDHRHLFTALFSATTVAILAGCDWSSGGGADGFNSSRITASVAGVYRSQTAGGPLVTNYESDASGGVEVIKDEQIGVGDDNATTFSAKLSKETVLPGSVKVFGGGIVFSDDGNGNLVGNPQGTGSIVYDNGAISVRFAGTDAPDSGALITADYSYSLQFNSSVSSGASATTIYSFNVQQAGDSIRFVDNNGDSYTGKLGGSQVSGNPATDANLTERLQFEVNGTSRGIPVKISGIFTVDLTVQPGNSETITITSTSNDSGSSQTQERDIQIYGSTSLQIDGTWIEPNAQGNVRGVVY